MALMNDEFTDYLGKMVQITFGDEKGKVLVGTVKSAADVSARGLARIRDVLAAGKGTDGAQGGQPLERVLKALGDNSQATTSAIERLTSVCAA